MTEQKRAARNFIVNWPLQSRIIYYFIAFSLGIVGLMMVFLNSHIITIHELVSNVPGMPMSAQLQIDVVLAKMLSTALGFLLIAVVGSLLYAVIISHRVAGPMFAIIKYIDSLKAGNYDDQRNLRPYDELKPIMDSLQDLSKNLKNK